MVAGTIFHHITDATATEQAGSVFSHTRDAGLDPRPGALFTHTRETPERVPLLPSEAVSDFTFGLDKLAFVPFYVISTTTAIDLTATGTTDLYTIPSGETPVVLGAIFEVTTVNTVTADAQISIGIAAGETDIIATTPLVGLDTLDDTYTVWVVAKSVHGTASDVIRLNVQTAATATSLIATVRLIALQA